MSIEKFTEEISAQAKNVAPFGASLKFVIDDQAIHLDGSGEENIVTNDDKDADCLIITDSATFEKLKAGSLNPMMAVMGGKVKIKGDMSLAMKLQSLI